MEKQPVHVSWLGPSTWVQIQLKNSPVDGAYKILYFEEDVVNLKYSDTSYHYIAYLY